LVVRFPVADKVVNAPAAGVVPPSAGGAAKAVPAKLPLKVTAPEKVSAGVIVAGRLTTTAPVVGEVVTCPAVPVTLVTAVARAW